MIIHCPDDGVGILRLAALALCLAPRLVRKMRPVSAEGSPAGLRRNSHNDRAVEIAVIAPKPVEFKVKLEICLKIENRLARLYVAKYV